MLLSPSLVLKRFKETTFRRQLMLFSAVGVVCVSLLAALATSWLGSRQLRTNQLQEGERIAHSLAAQSRLALIFGSTDNVAEAVTAAQAFPDVIRVEVHHADGRWHGEPTQHPHSRHADPLP